MHPNYLFLDTEWADSAGTELVSLALVSADGAHRFYAERDPLPASPTRFVAEHVYPLLDRGAVALEDRAFSLALRRFLASVKAPSVLFDCHTDGVLLRHALADFDVYANPKKLFPAVRPVLTLMHRGVYFSALLESWFAADPARAARRHHAAVDAEALRASWLAVTGADA